ncbi:hypothetical protein RIF29_28776 [Crotalaria pallida]|uniref:Uncharacterized protein n=1 Tax=Crotalaria pallida TaxID=3830 RepID=A0AAN9HVB6_CROPI
MSNQHNSRKVGGSTKVPSASARQSVPTVRPTPAKGRRPARVFPIAPSIVAKGVASKSASVGCPDSSSSSSIFRMSTVRGNRAPKFPCRNGLEWRKGWARLPIGLPLSRLLVVLLPGLGALIIHRTTCGADAISQSQERECAAREKVEKVEANRVATEKAFGERLRALEEENVRLKDQLSGLWKSFESQLNESQKRFEKMRQKALKHKRTSKRNFLYWEKTHEE